MPSTPSRLEVRRRIAEALGVELNQVWVRRMITKTGTHIIIGEAHVYDDPAKALKMEPEHIIRRNKPPEGGEEK
jgi:ribosomal protein S24E